MPWRNRHRRASKQRHQSPAEKDGRLPSTLTRREIKPSLAIAGFGRKDRSLQCYVGLVARSSNIIS